jgi:hypothetical protein
VLGVLTSFEGVHLGHRPPAKPPIQRWRPHLRERFERELERLEAKNLSDTEDAVAQSARRSEEAS